MKRLILAALLVALCGAAGAQKPKKKQQPKPQPPTVLSVGEIMGNYDIDTAWLGDTAGIMRYLDEQEQDYVALTNLCVSIRTRAQKAIHSIENDYEFRDSLIWLDSNTVLADFPIYEYHLRNLADLMGRMSVQYTRMEHQRIEAEKEAARQRAIEEARRQQEERNRIASDLRSNIELHHRAIVTACDGAGITDKTKIKELKDLYYSYLMVYNKYDLSTGNATDESIARLDELNAFQNDLLENVLGHNSLPYQIENFKNVLKVRCEKGNSDIYRSYSKVFKNTSVPVNFADIREYENYINNLHTVINIQQRYLQTLELRSTIAANSEAIANQYGKKYRQIASSYKDVAHGINTLPSFTTNAESILFIDGLNKFVEAQQLYMDFYPQIEEITQRSDSIMRRGIARGKVMYDVVVAYRTIAETLLPIPAFSTPEEALLYENELDEVRQVQQSYLSVLERRETIAANDDSIASARKLDRVLANGYKLLRKQADLSPNFATVERGRSFIDMLDDHIQMQQVCLSTIGKLREIERNEKTLTSKDSPYRNITKAYNRMAKAYRGIDEITNNEDLRRYNRQCGYIIDMQNTFLEVLRSQSASEIDSKLRKESSIDKIKLIMGID